MPSLNARHFSFFYCILMFIATTLVGPIAQAADSVWSTDYLNSRKGEWEQLIGPTIKIEGRVSARAKHQMKLVKCDLVFMVAEQQLKHLDSKQSVELTGRFKKVEGKIAFDVGSVKELPSDVDQYHTRARKLRNPKSNEWYELGNWAAERADFYDDSELKKLS
ncbi:MAG: hypothetical protein FJ267_10620, partial [Planctomycetes bacterium]|nr:hypothetical protein [Planctomycetota bacterium]